MWNILQKWSASRSKAVRNRQFDDVDYTQLTETENGFVDSEFAIPPLRIPWRSIILAIIFIICGTLTILIGSLFASGHIQKEYSDRMWPIIILGVLMLLPGFYHVKRAMKTYRKVPGLTFDDIPEFE